MVNSKKTKVTGRCYRINGLLEKITDRPNTDLQLKELDIKELEEKEESLIDNLSVEISYLLLDLEATKRELKRALFEKDK